MKQTIVLDFDGVIHSYSSGWKGAGVVPDPPTEGAREAVAKLREKYYVVVVSSRCESEFGINAILRWLELHDIKVDNVQAHKPPHIVVVDDRALRFEGCWQAVLDGVEAASVPWNKKEVIRLLEAEVERLKRGDFTEEEFHNLCHCFCEAGAERFALGCVEHNKK